MSEVYIGLRQRRKRTHPSKCPCCKNDGESEPENDEAAGLENHKEASEVRQSKRKRQTKEIDKNNQSEDEISDHSEGKHPAKKRKLRNTSTEKDSTTNKEAKSTVSKNKGRTANQNKGTKVPNKNKNSVSKTKKSKNNKNSKSTQQFSDEDYDSEDEKEGSTVSKTKNIAVNSRTRKGIKAKVNKAKSGNKEITSGDTAVQTKRNNTRKPKVDKKAKTARRTPMEKASLSFTKSQQNTNTLVGTQLKVAVFDNLFHKLKVEMKDISVEQGANLLMTISSESLQRALDASQNPPAFHGSETRHEKKGVSDTEEIVSQAAEALVSFRSKSPISRDEARVEKASIQAPSINTTAVITTQAEQVKTGSVTSVPAASVVESLSFTSLPPQTLTATSVTASKATSILPAMLPTVSVTQSFPQLLPQNLTTTFTNLMPMVTSHGTLPSFNQIAAQLRPGNSLPGSQPMTGITSPIINTSLPNHSLPTSLVLPQQPLIQPQVKQPFPLIIPNPTTNPMTSSFATSKSTLTTAKSTGNKTTTAKQNPLQQPLKGMEEVIGNVGSAVPQSIVWNIKSPVVFLGSPQNLGGVPRNLVASPSTSQSSVSLDQGGYPPVAPRPVAKSDGHRISQAPVSTVPNVLTFGGRPILPRTQMTDDSTRLQTSQTGISLLPSFSGLNVYQGTPSLQASTQVSSANPKKPTQMSVNITPSTTSMGTLLQQNLQETSSSESLSPSSVSAKQAVKKLVHERTKSAELKKEGTGSCVSHQPTKLKPILPLPPKEPSTVPGTSAETMSKSTEFNLEQAATALLSIGVPDGIEAIGLKHSSLNSKDDNEEDVVFTSKGTFRVGDVDVDPRYNRIGREGYTCGKCNKIFTSLSYLARHIKRVCPDMTCRKWKCSLCDKAFRHPFGLQQHVYTHTGERPHKCPLCPKAFYSSNDLRRHSRIHSGERPYRCKHCDKSFATTISLKTHTYIHTGEKPHKCPQCPKTFATSSKLGRHIVTHSEQRPFSCDQCPKSFNRSGDLRRHNLAVHDGKEKSFDCDLCPSTFTKSADLRRHTTTIHQKIVKTLECEDCGTQFSTPLCLKMHKDTYHKKPSSADSDNVHTCDVCGKTYSNATLLAKHKTTHESSPSVSYNPTQFQHIAPKPSEQTTTQVT